MDTKHICLFLQSPYSFIQVVAFMTDNADKRITIMYYVPFLIFHPPSLLYFSPVLLMEIVFSLQLELQSSALTFTV